MRYVIIGGGITGTTAAEELRKIDADAEITIVSEEQHPLYSRVLLPHFIKEKIPRERVFLKKESWYEEKNIIWLRGERVEKLDPKNKFVQVTSGQEIEYDKLLIATGGDVRVIGQDVRGVSYFRTLDDADHIVQLLQERKSDAHGVVYGGGFIACEYINIFEKYGMPATVAFRGDHFWSAVLDDESGKLINDRILQGGFALIPRATDMALEGEKELEAVSFGDKRIPCSFLGVGIGMVRDDGWIREAGVEIEAGVRSNEFLETNVPDVFTAGDCAQFHDVIVDRPMFVGNWMNAMSQGRAVAKSMMGERTPFKLVSSYATNVLGLEIIFVGDAEKAAADEVIVRGSSAEGGVTQVFLRGGRVVGGTMVGRNADRTPITKLIQSRADIGNRAKSWENSANPIE